MSTNQQRRWILFLSPMVLLFFWALIAVGRTAKGAGLDPLLLAQVTRGDLEISVLDIGRIEPREKVAIKSKVAGLMGKVLVEEGMVVKKGQLLLELEPEEFQRNLARAHQEVQKVRVEVELAKLTLDRRTMALAERGITQIEVDSAKSEYAMKRIMLRQAKESERSNQDQLRYSRIASPIDGVVMNRNIRVGETVVPGTMATMDDRSLLVIGDLATLVVKTDLNQIDIAKVKLGQDVTLSLDSLPGKIYKAKVSKVSPSAVQRMGREVEVFPIEATLVGSNLSEIKPGMIADMTIHIDIKKKILKLPIEAVTLKRGQAYVNLVRSDPKHSNNPVTERVDVELGDRNDREQEIRSGLSEGDTVLIKPPTSEANEYN